jgi:hypothetical protein
MTLNDVRPTLQMRSVHKLEGRSQSCERVGNRKEASNEWEAGTECRGRQRRMCV